MQPHGELQAWLDLSHKHEVGLHLGNAKQLSSKHCLDKHLICFCSACLSGPTEASCCCRHLTTSPLQPVMLMPFEGAYDTPEKSLAVFRNCRAVQLALVIA